MEQLEHTLFQNKNFKRDLYKYNLFGNFLERKLFNIETDNINYAIISFENGITWLWTKDEIDEETLKEITKCLPESGEIIYKKKISNFMKANMELPEVEEYGCYYCTKTIKPERQVEGHMVKATADNVLELANLWMLNCEEKDPVRKYGMTIEKCIKFINTWMNEEEFYVWKNNNDDITCFASYKENEDESIIEHAYTKKEFRGNGYMANLIYGITNIILDSSKLPVLQTDIAYIPSNSAYVNVGYILDDILVKSNYVLLKNKKM